MKNYGLIIFLMLKASICFSQYNSLEYKNLFHKGIYIENLKLVIPWQVDYTEIEKFGKPNISNSHHFNQVLIQWPSVQILNGIVVNLYISTPSQITTPKAYLNIIFFDEQFRFVPANSNAVPIEEAVANADKIGTLVIPPTTVLKNGYVYIYLSNESTVTPVYFDDFAVRHDRAAIVEDNAYYPYGLKIAGISAKAALKPKTKYGYQGDYCEEDVESGYNEFALRNYDPQIGKWIQVDPYNEISSGYVGMGNDPVNTIDKTGGGIFEGMNLASRTLVGTVGGAIIGGIVAKIGGRDGDKAAKWIAYGALIGGGATYFASSPISINIQFVPNWKQVLKDGERHGGFFKTAYLGAKVRSIMNEIFSLGKIVTVTGDGFVAGKNNNDTKDPTISKGTLTTNVIKYFKNHPNAKRVANAFTEFHSGYMGSCSSSGPSQFCGISGYFDAESIFLYGNCFQAPIVEATSTILNGAEVIGSYNQQLELPFAVSGHLSGNPRLITDDIDEQNLVVPPNTAASPTSLNPEFLHHRVAQNGRKAYDGRATTKINFSGRISYKVIGEAKARIMNDIYYKISSNVFKNIFSLIINGF